MERFRRYRFELMPTGEQARKMRQFAGSCRFVYNRALMLQKERYERGEKTVSAFTMSKDLTAWRHSKETSWLYETPVHPLQQSLRDLEWAYKNFFKGRAGFPRFHKKGSHENFRYPLHIKFEECNNRIFLVKLGWIWYRNCRKVNGEIRNVTIIISGGKYFISILTRLEVTQSPHPSTSVVGIDLGVAVFATMSDGTSIESINSLKKHRNQLCRYQKQMDRKVNFSNNWQKAKAKVNRTHAKIVNTRKDFLHKTSTTLAKNHSVVIVEDLYIANISKSARGSISNPGRNVKQKTGLNRSILDQGWGIFRRLLGYKMAHYGGTLIAVPAQYTSQMCPECGYISRENRKTRGKFLCVQCGYKNNADLVASINIKERGQRLLACGEMAQSGRSMKQEPTETTRAVAA